MAEKHLRYIVIILLMPYVIYDTTNHLCYIIIICYAM